MNIKKLTMMLCILVAVGLPCSLWAGMAIDENKLLVYHSAASITPSIITVDVSNPANPIQIGNVSIGASARRIFLDSNRNLLFAAQGNAGLEIIDVSDPTAAVVIGGWSNPTFEVSLHNNIAYLATNGAMIEIADTSNPGNVTWLPPVEYFSFNAYGTPTRTLSSKVNNGYLWIGGIPNDMNAYEITGPGQLTRLVSGANFAAFGPTDSIAFGNNVTLGVNGNLLARQISSSPFLGRVLNVDGMVTVAGTRAYVGWSRTTRIFDITDVTSLAETGSFLHAEELTVGGTPYGMGSIGTMLFIQYSSATSGFSVFDVSVPDSPVLVAKIPAAFGGTTDSPQPDPEPVPAPAPAPEPEPSPVPETNVHVSDLDGNGEMKRRNRWRAKVYITVRDHNSNPVENAVVEGNWSGGASGSDDCETDSLGQCRVKSDRVSTRNPTITFTVTSISHNSLDYNATVNSDPDGDSNGTAITVNKP